MHRLVAELKGQKAKNIESKNRLDVALKDVRRLNKKIGELEQHARMREESSAGAGALGEPPNTRAAEIEKLQLQHQEEIEKLKQELAASKAQQRHNVALVCAVSRLWCA
jgi:hypothetical protein